MDPLWIVFITVAAACIITGIFEYFRSKIKKRNRNLERAANTTRNGSDVVYIIPSNGSPAIVAEDAPPSYDECVINIDPPPPAPDPNAAAATNSNAHKDHNTRDRR